MPPTILCIDDHEQGLFIRKTILQQRGYVVLTATSGARGLSLIEQHEVDAVVLDYRMEGIDGGAVASIIKRRKPEIPIVMLSGYVEELPDRVLKVVDAVVEKGQAAKALYSTVSKLIPADHSKAN